MSHITTEKANQLFWLGRYVERVYTTVIEYFKGYDRMIDEAADSYPEFCRRMSIPNVYADKEDFLRNYPFDDSNPDSIISNLIRAYDNAVVLRDDIGSDTLSYIRLFAIGLTGSILGGVFNTLAISMTEGMNIVLRLICMAIILLLGHAINFGLCTISSLVHPLRLIFVEYYKNAEFEGGGKAYTPFKKA